MVSAAVECKAINPWLIWVCFKLKTSRVFLLVAFAPVSSASLGEFEKFWGTFRDVLGSFRENEKNIISGDLNAWVGTARSGYEGVLGQYDDKTINETGKLVLETCKERNL